MGLYSIPCKSCGKTFMWFSGNLTHQVCERCSKPPTDEAQAFTVCLGCKNVIDPDCCGCGTDRRIHGNPILEGHEFVPAGCDCLRSKKSP